MTTMLMPAVGEATGTPESQRLDELEAMLENPDYAGFRAEIQASIDDLRATTFVRDLAA